MSDLNYDRQITGLLVIDPYNDFISEGGKSFDRIKGVAEANQCVPNMLGVLDAARRAGLRIFYALHHRYRPGDYETWRYIAPIQTRAWRSKVFEDGTWGGQIRPGFEPGRDEVVAQEHWCSSGFANTDLDLQLKVQVFTASSSLDYSRTRASRRRSASPPSSATTSRSSRTRRRATRRGRCTPLSR